MNPLARRSGQHPSGPARTVLVSVRERQRLTNAPPYRLAGVHRRRVRWLQPYPSRDRTQTWTAPVYLADATVRGIHAVLRSCLSSAVRDGVIRHNPAKGIELPERDEDRRIALGLEDAEPQVKVLTDDQLGWVLALVPDDHRALFALLAGTGLRRCRRCSGTARRRSHWTRTSTCCPTTTDARCRCPLARRVAAQVAAHALQRRATSRNPPMRLPPESGRSAVSGHDPQRPRAR